MEAILLAGGLGTRLATRLNGVPKPMAPVAGRPFLEILLNQVERAGCTRALLSVGTGGAIRAALLQATEEYVLVLNGDTFLQADYAALLAFHAAEGASLTMAITLQEDIARYGGVLVAGKRIVGFQEKGQSGSGWINAGAYVLNRNLKWPQSLPKKFSFETDFLVPETCRLAPAAYEVDGFFLDIGVPEDLDRAQTELASFAS